MESNVVKEAVDFLINARPSSTAAGGTETTQLSTSLNELHVTAPPVESRKITVKRKSIAFPVKCNCGRCSKCVPSPSGKVVPTIKTLGTYLACVFFSDWIWNGSKFVQVSKEWKMSDSSDSIQSLLCTLIENVEVATQKVVNQRMYIHTYIHTYGHMCALNMYCCAQAEFVKEMAGIYSMIQSNCSRFLDVVSFYRTRYMNPVFY